MALLQLNGLLHDSQGEPEMACLDASILRLICVATTSSVPSCLSLVHDGDRERIDEVIVEAKDLPDISVLRGLLSHELIVSFSPLY